MNKRKRQVLAAVMLVAVPLALALRAYWSAESDEVLYRRWQQPGLVSCLPFLAKHLPSRLFEALHLPTAMGKYSAKDRAIRDKLLASGYLTNESVVLSNPASRSPEGLCRAFLTCLESGVKMQFNNVRTSAAFDLICRPRDVAFCRRVLEGNCPVEEANEVSAANRNQPVGAPTNRTSSAAGSGR